MAKSILDWIVLVLVIVGGLNWGLVGINPGWNLVEIIFGSVAWLAKTIYILVGLAALYLIYYVSKD
jgi:hypothetical protein